MKSHLDIGGNAVEQVARTTKTVFVVQICLVCAVIAIFALLIKRDAELHDAIREDAIWAVYQLDRETRAVYELVYRIRFIGRRDGLGVAQEIVSPKTLGIRYDILYSRLSVLANAKYNAYFERNADISATIEEIRNKILAMEPAFNRIAAQGHYGGVDFDVIEAELTDTRDATNNFLVRTNATISIARADARNDIFNTQMQAFLFMIAIVLAALFFAANMLRQVRIVKRTREGLTRAAIEFEKAYEAAEAGNKAKSAFLATIGHEIRTPLNAILGMAELLAHKPLPEEESGYVRTISSSGTALLEMINEILDFAKMEHGSDQSEESVFRLDELVNDAVSVVKGQALKQNNEVTVSLKTCLRGVSVSSDPSRLKRVLLNLLSNAVKFTENGRVTVRAGAEVSGNDGTILRFEVSDTGIGISEDAQENLFRAFHQVDSSISRRFGGTGLGLAICKQIVEDMGGSIGVNSQPDKGTTFTFQVPVRVVSAVAPAPLAPEPSSDADSAPLPRLKVLLVEDNVINQRVAVKFLERLGQDVSIANDGRCAVEYVQEELFDVVLMDVQMPDVDGITATKAIRGLGGACSGLPIIAMTANASGAHRRECLAAGMNAFETKPVTFRRLETLLRQYVPADFDRKIAAPEAACEANACGRARALQTVSVLQGQGAERQDTADTDTSRQAELLVEFGNEVYAELVDDFFENADTLVEQVAEAVRTEDATTYDRVLHTLKGAADNLGFSNVSATADALRAVQGDANQVTRLKIALNRARSQNRRIAV